MLGFSKLAGRIPVSRFLATTCRLLEKDGITKIRNFGVMAHIDAGKTTTTERMLYYAGVTHGLGEVHHGNTVTDFLPQEQERGITIQSAAVSFPWGPWTFQLIDTPGHIDFTSEVEHAAHVLDGALVLVDAVAGVQAQTSTVWAQSGANEVPALLFVNKLDRVGANWDRALNSIKDKLQVTPLPLQIPLLRDEVMYGVIDVVHRVAYIYEDAGRDDGSRCVVYALETPKEVGREASVFSPSSWFKEGVRAGSGGDTAVSSLPKIPANLASKWKEEISKVEDLREEVSWHLADHDEGLGEELLMTSEEDCGVSGLPTDRIVSSIREVLKGREVVPALCGTALKNRGVQPLMDAIGMYLPSPQDVPGPKLTNLELPKDNRGREENSRKAAREARKTAKSNKKLSKKGGAEEVRESEGRTTPDPNAPLVAYAFKVVHDPTTKHPLVFARVFSGTLNAKDTLYVPWRGRSGDSLAAQKKKGGTVAPSAGQKFLKERMQDLFKPNGEELERVSLLEPGSIGVIKGLKHVRAGDTIHARQDPRVVGASSIPPPVFSCAVEPESSKDEATLNVALDAILREDPSLSVRIDNQTGQTLLSGMGELHLDVAVSRLKSSHGAKLSTGSMLVAYKEVLLKEVETTADSSGVTETTGTPVSVTVELSPTEDPDTPCGTFVDIAENSGDMTESATDILARDLTPMFMDAVDSLQKGGGPYLGLPLVGFNATLKKVESEGSPISSVNGGTTPAIRRAINKALITATRDAGSTFVEPMMSVNVTVDPDYAGAVSRDISSKRRGTVQLLEAASDGHSGTTIEAEAPLARLIGFSSELRSLTKGTASLQLQFSSHQRVPQQAEEAVVMEIRGY